MIARLSGLRTRTVAAHLALTEGKVLRRRDVEAPVRSFDVVVVTHPAAPCLAPNVRCAVGEVGLQNIWRRQTPKSGLAFTDLATARKKPRSNACQRATRARFAGRHKVRT